MNWPEELKNDILDHKCVIFIGAGVSKNSKNDRGNTPPTWKEFLIEASDKLPNNDVKTCVTEIINNNDYLMACELLRNLMGPDAFYDFTKEKFDNGYIESDLHKLIFRLGSLIYMTPNFDKIFDTYARTVTHGKTVVKEYHEQGILNCIRRSDQLIIKMHGSIDNDNKMIFTKSDYAKARINNTDFYKILEALILTKTFLFIGAGLNDPDVQLIFENMAFSFRNSRKHFFVTPEIRKDILDVYSKTMNLKFIEYSNPTGSHDQLQVGLTELVDELGL